MSRINPYLLTIILSILLYNCTKNISKTSRINYVYNDLLIEIIDGSVTDYRKLMVPGPHDFINGKPTDELLKRKQKINDSIFTPLKVYLLDSLVPIPDVKFALNKIEFYFKTDKHAFNECQGETKNKNLIKLINESILVKARDKYAIELIKSLDQVNNKPSLPKYRLTYPYFCEKTNKGFMLATVYYSPLNYYSVLILFEKINNQWEILNISDYSES